MVERNTYENEDTETKRPILLAISTITILLIVVTGIFVYICSSKFVSKIVLITFVVIILLVGLVMIVYIEYQRRKAIKNKEQGAQRWIQNTVDVQTRRPKPSAPPLSERSSWALIPRKWSTGTALPAYTTTPTVPPINS